MPPLSPWTRVERLPGDSPAVRTVALSRIGATRGPLVFQARTLPLELRKVQKHVATRAAVSVYFEQDLFPPRPGQARPAGPSQGEVAPCPTVYKAAQDGLLGVEKVV